MNLPLLAPHLSPSDAEVASAQSTGNGTAPGVIAAGLLERGHRVSVVTFRQGEGPLRLVGDQLDVTRIDFSRPKLRRALTRWTPEIKALRHAMRSSSADVIHSHWPYEASLAAVRTGRPHVATIRDAPITVLRHYRSPIRVIRATIAYEFRYRSSQTLLSAPSPYLSEQWAKQMLDHRPVAVVPNIAPDDMLITPVPSSHPTILEVSDDGRRKNVPLLLRAFAFIRNAIPAAELRLVGRGLSTNDSLHAWAVQNSLHRGVSFVGPLTRDELRVEYSRAWIHLHGALEETFGNTLVEAMMAQLPVVGGRFSGAVPWVLDDGESGLLVDVMDAAEVADACIRLLSNDSMREELGARSRASAILRFSADAVIDQYLSLYTDAINRNAT